MLISIFMLTMTAGCDFTMFGGLSNMTVKRDVPYSGSDSHQRQKLDIYAPNNSTTPMTAELRPIVVFVHGGGWSIGRKTYVQSKPQHFVDQGYIFVSVGYRLSPEVMHPAHAEDVAEALAWIAAHATEFNGDSERVILMGHSAGAHLVSLVGADPKFLGQHQLSPSWLKSVISLDTASHDIEAASTRRYTRKMVRDAFGTDVNVLRDASPINHVKADRTYPPFLLVYAERRLESFMGNSQMNAALIAAGGSSELLKAKGKDHGGVNKDIGKPGDQMTADIDAYIKRVLAPTARVKKSVAATEHVTPAAGK